MLVAGKSRQQTMYYQLTRYTQLTQYYQLALYALCNLPRDSRPEKRAAGVIQNTNHHAMLLRTSKC
jgi:hypothetical protein